MGWGGKGKSWGKDSWGGGGWGSPMSMFMPMMEMFSKGKGKGKPKNRLGTFKTETKVWLGGIPETMKYDKPSEEGHKKLKEHLSQAGKCNFVSVSKGQGGAAFSTAEEATAAIAMLNGSTFEGAVIEVDVWTKKEK
mmetsp:Transcript_55832/g.104972  ORF Transcript_55832/g.104972 Transcript_55832/m.104972 type:complete len:136 (-) Transcript_55832:83-490(-)